MSSLQIAYNNASVTQFGNTISGTAFNTGFRVNTNGNNCTFDFFFTGANSVELNAGLYVSGANALTALLMDTSGATVGGIGTNPIQPTFTTASLSVQNVTYFSGLTAATTYWLRLSFVGFGNQIIQSDKLVQLTGTSTTPTVSVVTGYDPTQVYGFAAGFDGVTGLGFTAAANKGVVNTKATSRVGDEITLVGSGTTGVTGWNIQESFGIYARVA